MSVRLTLLATVLVVTGLSAQCPAQGQAAKAAAPAEAASGPGGAASGPAKAAFDSLSVQVEEQVATAVRQQRIVKIDGAGSVQFVVESAPGTAIYTGKHQLSRQYLAELEGLLKQTDWLDAPRGGEKPPPAPGGGRLSMRLALVRNGRTTSVALSRDEKDLAKPYQQLHNFLYRLYRQEQLYYEATGLVKPDPALRQRSIAQQIGWEIDTVGSGGGGGFVPALDYSRLVKPLEGLLARQEIANVKDVIGVLKLVGYVRDATQWDAIVSLRQRLTGDDQPQATEALLRIGGPRAKEILSALTPKDFAAEGVAKALLALEGDEKFPALRRLLAESHNRYAADIVALGTPALPHLLAWLAEKPSQDQVLIVRAYLENWEKLGPPPAEIAAAVRDNIAAREGTPQEPQYQFKLLLKAWRSRQQAGRLGFGILAAEHPNLQRELDELAAKGPQFGPHQLNYEWFELACTPTTAVAVGEHKQKKYVLTWIRPGQLMFSDESGYGAWGLKSVSAGADGAGKPAVKFQFDENGQRSLKDFTRAVQGMPNKVLGVIVDERVVATGDMKLLETGTFAVADAQQAEALAKAIQQGMPARAASRPSRFSYGPVVTLTLEGAGWHFVDIESGKDLQPDFRLEPKEEARPLSVTNVKLTDELKTWLMDKRIDLIMDIGKSGIGLAGVGLSREMGSSPPEQAWETLAADELAKNYLRMIQPSYPPMRGFTFGSGYRRTDRPVSTFMTGDKNLGIYRIAMAAEPAAWQVQYRMVKDAERKDSTPATAPAGGASASSQPLDAIALEAKWVGLGDEALAKATAAMRDLTGQGQAAVPFIRGRLALLLGKLRPKDVGELVAAAMRGQQEAAADAAQKLSALGRAGRSAVMKAYAEATNPAVAARLVEILDAQDSCYAKSADDRRLVRATWLLHLIGGKQSDAALEELELLPPALPKADAAAPRKTRKLQRDDYVAASQLRDAGDRLMQAFTDRYRQPDWAEPGSNIAADAAEVAATYLEVISRYAGSELAAYCYRVRGLFNYRDRSRAALVLREKIWQFRGTYQEAEAYFSLALQHQHQSDKAAEMLALLDRVKLPAAVAEDDRNDLANWEQKVYAAKAAAVRAAAEAKQHDLALQRVQALNRDYPEYRDNHVRSFRNGLEMSGLKGDQVQQWLAKLDQLPASTSTSAPAR